MIVLPTGYNKHSIDQVLSNSTSSVLNNSNALIQMPVVSTFLPFWLEDNVDCDVI